MKIYSGKQNHKVLLEDLSNSGAKRIKVLFSEKSTIPKKELSEVYGKIKTRMGSIEVFEIHAKKPTKKALDFIKQKTANNKDTVDVIIADKVYIFEKENGYTIEQDTAIKAYRNFFNLLWESLK
jgi:Iap family predicted aminopeptidase